MMGQENPDSEMLGIVEGKKEIKILNKNLDKTLKQHLAETKSKKRHVVGMKATVGNKGENGLGQLRITIVWPKRMS